MWYFDKFYNTLLAYREEYGNVDIPQKYCVDGYRVGKEISCVRQGIRKVTEEQKQMLDAIGFIWRKRKHYPKRMSLDEVIVEILKYKDIYGDCSVPVTYISPDTGIYLGRIVNSLRTGNRKTTAEEKKRLDAIGFAWKSTNHKVGPVQLSNYLEEYRKEFGNYDVPNCYRNQDGVWLGKIVYLIRKGERSVNDVERKALNAIGFEWEPILVRRKVNKKQKIEQKE